MPLVIKLGGHLFAQREINAGFIKSVCSVLREVHKPHEKWAIVVGGGLVARAFIESARQLGSDEATCDEIAIQITRVNASLFIQALRGLAHPAIPTTLSELKTFLTVKDVAVVGGLWPGQSTFAVAALCSQAIGAEKMIVATDVEGVYDSDPKLNPDAKLIKKMSYKELRKIIAQDSQRAGEYRLIDSVGLSILERSKTRLLFVNGKNPENLKRALMYDEAGTVIE